MVDLAKHPMPDWFMSWLGEHYWLGNKPYHEGDPNPYMRHPLLNKATGEMILPTQVQHPDGSFECKRCGMYVWAAMKHARNVHGDDIDVVPTHPKWIAQGMAADEQGRRIKV